MWTQKQLESAAYNSGYENYKDYADDEGLARCVVCDQWGIYGHEIFNVYEDGKVYRQYCEKHHPDLDR